MKPLAQQLHDFREQAASQLPPDALSAFARGTDQVKQSGLSRSALAVGDEMVQFALRNALGDIVYSQELLAKGPLLISFYRGGWCPYCNLELRALQERLPEIHAADATLVAISPETPDNSLSTREKNELAFPVLSDKDNDVAKAFGLVFSFSDELKDTYQKLNIDLAAINGTDVFELPMPASYVVAPNGIITYAFVEEDYSQRADPERLVRALKAIDAL